MELHISMIPSPEDPPWMSAAYQSGLRELGSTLRADGLEIHDVGVHFAGTERTPALSGQWSVELGAALGPVLGAPVGSWLQARRGRTVRLTIGKIEADVRTGDELVCVIRTAKLYQDVAESDS
jgi:hypothetical protein